MLATPVPRTVLSELQALLWEEAQQTVACLGLGSCSLPPGDCLGQTMSILWISSLGALCDHF